MGYRLQMVEPCPKREGDLNGMVQGHKQSKLHGTVASHLALVMTNQGLVSVPLAILTVLEFCSACTDFHCIHHKRQFSPTVFSYQ